MTVHRIGRGSLPVAKPGIPNAIRGVGWIAWIGNGPKAGVAWAPFSWGIVLILDRDTPPQTCGSLRKVVWVEVKEGRCRRGW